MQVDINADARRPVTRQAKHLSLRGGVHRIEAGTHQHLFAVKRPTFDEKAVAVLAANFIAQMVRDRELKKMSRDAFVPENRPRIFDGRTNVEVLALRIVRGNE